MATPNPDLNNSNVAFLGNDYFLRTNTECDICKSDREADPPSSEAAHNTPLSNISYCSVVKTVACSHIFHELCLASWFQTQVHQNSNGTCPMCRHIIVRIRSPREEIERLQAQLGQVFEVLTRRQRMMIRRMRARMIEVPAGARDPTGE